MRTMPRILAAAGLILGACGATASAQEETTAATSNADAATTALENLRPTLSEIERLEGAKEVQIISIESVGSTQGEALQSMLESRKADVRDLQSAIGANDELMDMLNSEDPDFSLDSVVAADVREEEDTLFVYVLAQGASN